MMGKSRTFRNEPLATRPNSRYKNFYHSLVLTEIARALVSARIAGAGSSHGGRTSSRRQA